MLPLWLGVKGRRLCVFVCAYITCGGAGLGAVSDAAIMAGGGGAAFGGEHET